ncbi:MAG: HIT family protein [Haloquadratum sp.]|jgi:histidine triad (HIT) family protein|nr:HIT family protein [Haloferacaceae archaeon]MDR9445232.1 HIT family protein [Haloquadratum sp.]
MADATIFERIIDGEIPARIVYETAEVCAFLDAQPLAPGHTLVVPTAAVPRLAELDADAHAALFAAVRTLLPRVQTAVEADAMTVGINDGPAAGQEVPHVHVHLIPRFDDDGGASVHAVTAERPSISDAQADAIAAAIRP